MSEPEATTSSTSRTPAVRPVPPGELELLVHGSHGNPHDILGLHAHDGGLTLRALRPQAREVVAVLPDGSRTPLKLPDERHGLLFVFRVFDRMSYALILTVKDPVAPGDRFTQP